MISSCSSSDSLMSTSIMADCFGVLTLPFGDRHHGGRRGDRLGGFPHVKAEAFELPLLLLFLLLDAHLLLHRGGLELELKDISLCLPNVFLTPLGVQLRDGDVEGFSFGYVSQGFRLVLSKLQGPSFVPLLFLSGEEPRSFLLLGRVRQRDHGQVVGLLSLTQVVQLPEDGGLQDHGGREWRKGRFPPFWHRCGALARSLVELTLEPLLSLAVQLFQPFLMLEAGPALDLLVELDHALLCQFMFTNGFFNTFEGRHAPFLCRIKP